MRIAILSHGASGGGSERVCTLIANYLVEKGHDVFFYAIHSDKREYYIDERVHYVYGDCPGSNKAIRFYKRTSLLKRFLKKNKIEAFVSFIYDEGYAAYNNKRIKKIFSLRNDPNQMSKVKKTLIESLYKNADKVVFQTDEAKDFFCEKVREHGVVIPNPIKDNLPVWENSGSKEIIAAGRLSRQKNFSMLLEACASFFKKYPDYSLTICGEGDLKDELKNKAEQLGIADKVNFTGHVTDIHNRMSKAGIYVSSSDYEGLSNSMLEAMAIGIPTICTDCPIGGARMFIKNEVNGILVPVKDADSMSLALEKYAGDPELCRKVSENSRIIREQLDLATICEKWEKIIIGR